MITGWPWDCIGHRGKIHTYRHVPASANLCKTHTTMSCFFFFVSHWCLTIKIFFSHKVLDFAISKGWRFNCLAVLGFTDTAAPFSWTFCVWLSPAWVSKAIATCPHVYTLVSLIPKRHLMLRSQSMNLRALNKGTRHSSLWPLKERFWCVNSKRSLIHSKQPWFPFTSTRRLQYQS